MANLKSSNDCTPIRILHVDDDQSIQEITKLMLMDLSSIFVIDQACSVDDAFKKLAMGTYDVVVSDYEMPNKNGLEFLKELRERNNKIPFILFTGKGREEVAIKALNLGAEGYYNKQGSPETVYGELAHGIQTSFRQKQADELLRKSQAELKAIVNNSPSGIATSDSSSKFRSANEAFCRIVGYSEVELQKLSFKDITYSGDIEVSNEKMKELICGNISFFSQEKRYVRKDASIIDGKVTVSAIRNNEGKPVLFVAELEDITQRKQAEAELRRTFEVLERVGEGIDAGLAVISKDYRVVWANKRLKDLGVAPNKKCYETFNNIRQICPDCGVEKIFKQNLPLDVHEYRTVNSKGETIWVELRVTPLKDKEGNVTAALELAVPINERKIIEQSLRDSEEKFRGLAEESPNMIFINDRGRVVYVNKKSEEIMGYCKTEFYSSDFNFLSLISPEYSETLESAFAKHMKGEEVPQYEFELITRDGKRINALFNSKLIDYNGNKAIMGIVTDITELKKIENALDKKQKELNCILDSSPIIIFYKDREGKFVQANKAFAKALNVSKEALLGKTVFDFYSDKIARNMTTDDNSVFKSKTPKLNIVEPYDSPTGLRWIRTQKIPTFDAKGEVAGLIGFSEEITDYKKAEDSLRDSLNSYHSLIDGMIESVWVVDFEGNFIDVNRTAFEVLGFSKNELLALGIAGIDHYFSSEQIKGIISELLRGKKQVFETELTAKDGLKIPVEVSSCIVTYQGKQAILTIARNIIERKKIEKKLNDTLSKEKFLADLVRNASVAVAVGYPDGRVGQFNLAFEKMTGYNETELKKVSWTNVLTPPEWMPVEKAKLEELELTRKPVSYEKEYIRKDGSRVLIELSVHPGFDENGKITSYYAFINDISQRKRIERELRQSESQFRQLFSNMPSAAAVYEAVDEGQDFIFKDFNATAEKIENKKKEGVIGKRLKEVFPGVESFGVLEVFRRVWQSGEPEYYPAHIYKDEKDPGSWRENWVYKLPNGNIVAIYDDITERKQAEERLEETMNKLVLINEKLGVVGSLTRHDVGNKLMVAKSNLFLLKKKIGDDPDLIKYLDRIDTALALSDRIFEFSRLYEQIGVEKPSVENVFACFNQAVALFPELGAIKVVNECQRLEVVADSLLKRLFYNFVDNSLKHGQKVTQIQLQYIKDADGVKLIYKDDGIGIPKTDKSKLFQAGFSTGKSSGLGLHLIKKMTDVYGWSIVEEGELNKGVKFVICIPLSSVSSY